MTTAKEKVNTAKDRAEEMLQTMQSRAREFLAAEEGLVRTVRDLIEKGNLTPAEVKSGLEGLLGRIKANKVWDRIKTSDTLVALSDYRGELERRAEDTAKRFLGTLQIVTKADLDDLRADLTALEKKLDTMKKPSKSEASAKN